MASEKKQDYESNQYELDDKLISSCEFLKASDVAKALKQGASIDAMDAAHDCLDVTLMAVYKKMSSRQIESKHLQSAVRILKTLSDNKFKIRSRNLKTKEMLVSRLMDEGLKHDRIEFLYNFIDNLSKIDDSEKRKEFTEKAAKTFEGVSGLKQYKKKSSFGSSKLKKSKKSKKSKKVKKSRKLKKSLKISKLLRSGKKSSFGSSKLKKSKKLNKSKKVKKSRKLKKSLKIKKLLRSNKKSSFGKTAKGKRSSKRSGKRSSKKSPKRTNKRSSKKKSLCKNRLSKKIKINLKEFENKKQAIAVSYSQVKKKHPACKRHLSKKSKK